MFRFKDYCKEDDNFESFVYKSILRNTNGEVKIKNSKNNNLSIDNFRNIFETNGYEVNIKKTDINEYEFSIFKIESSYSFKLGCELEICIKLNCLEKSDYYRGKIKEINSINEESRNKLWKDMVFDFIKSNFKDDKVLIEKITL
jgi:hypothetical protein